MKKEHANNAQITIPAAPSEQEASRRTPHRLEQPQLESVDGKPFAWPERTTQPTQETPLFLKALGERGMAVTAACELLQQQAEQAERYERHLQQSRESYYRTKHPDPEVQREIWRANKARQRARQKQEAQPQEGQKSPGNRS